MSLNFLCSQRWPWASDSPASTSKCGDYRHVLLNLASLPFLSDFYFLRQGLTSCLVLNSFCNTPWNWDPLASASWIAWIAGLHHQGTFGDTHISYYFCDKKGTFTLDLPTEVAKSRRGCFCSLILAKRGWHLISRHLTKCFLDWGILLSGVLLFG